MGNESDVGWSSYKEFKLKVFTTSQIPCKKRPKLLRTFLNLNTKLFIFLITHITYK